MPKFLHTADWQMGRAFTRFETEDGAALVEARFEAIETLAQLANEHQCDAVLVAGDVFDAQTVSDRTIRRVFNATKGFAGPWVMLPGNHDAALAESVWTRAQRLGAVPENVHLALQPGVIDLEPQRLSILCAPLTQRHTYGDLTEPFSGYETLKVSSESAWPTAASRACCRTKLTQPTPSRRIEQKPAGSITSPWATGMAPNRSMNAPGTADRPSRNDSGTTKRGMP